MNISTRIANLETRLARVEAKSQLSIDKQLDLVEKIFSGVSFSYKPETAFKVSVSDLTGGQILFSGKNSITFVSNGLRARVNIKDKSITLDNLVQYFNQFMYKVLSESKYQDRTIRGTIVDISLTEMIRLGTIEFRVYYVPRRSR